MIKKHKKKNQINFFPFINFRTRIMSIILLLLFVVQTNCELTESVTFQPIDEIQTSKSSWIFSTAVDFLI